MPPVKEHFEHKSDHNTGRANARDVLTEYALTLYQCPDGSLVRHPSECKEQKTDSGSLEFSNIFKGL